MNVTTQIIMDLIDGYAETRHTAGHHTYNDKTALARKLVLSAVEVLYGMAKESQWQQHGSPAPFNISLVKLPVIDPSLLDVHNREQA